MAKNLITHLEIPLERKHEIAWILIKNNFKKQENSHDIFYNQKGQTIFLRYLNKTKGPYEFDVYLFNETILKEKIHLSGYEEIEKFISAFNISEKKSQKT